jgi:hypothetical protein
MRSIILYRFYINLQLQTQSLILEIQDLSKQNIEQLNNITHQIEQLIIKNLYDVFSNS